MRDAQPAWGWVIAARGSHLRMPQAAIKDIENEDNLGEARGGAPNFFGSSARLPKIDKFKISALECGGSCLKIRDSWPGGKKRLTSLYGGRIVRCTEHDDRNERQELMYTYWPDINFRLQIRNGLLGRLRACAERAKLDK